jgi:tetratricopeptide (TPR) repeat protein
MRLMPRLAFLILLLPACCLRPAAADDPMTSDAYIARGIAEADKSDYDHAIADFGAAIGLVPNDANAYQDRGKAYFEKRDYKHAIVDCAKAISLKSDFTMAFVTRAYAFAASGDAKKANDDAKKAIKLNPAVASRVWRDLGWIWYTTGDLRHAVAGYEKALAIAGDDTPTQFNLGLALAAAGDWDSAEPEYMAAASTASHGDVAEAMARLQDALKKDPQSSALKQAAAFLTSVPGR